ncbi:protein FAR-RED IMPAIRED RESPONSE 1-like [Lactuca sativa]|nr:protein FAR-RED IMPAIRED RESPONSE 1-like [Lactuca sativa]
MNNHKRRVTFGVSLLSREDTDSYIWLLKSFLKAFGKQPLLVLSDQDPTMKKAIETVFPQLIHRLYMWHITSKLPLKIFMQFNFSLNIVNIPKFRKKFNLLIWNSRLEVDEFEVGWKSLMNEYKLTDNKWLDDMHGLRRFWIPTFFKHVPLSGLMRTTSRSESENSAFHQNTHYCSTIVHFMISFEASMEKYRFTQSSFDFSTKDKHSMMRTPFKIERNASLLYTRTVYRQVQNEMYLSMVACSQISISTCEDVDECLVKEFIHYNSSNSNDSHIDPEVENDDQWDILIRELWPLHHF